MPGSLCAAMFPTIIGTEFPGALYLSQTLKFRNLIEVPTDLRDIVSSSQAGIGRRLHATATRSNPAG